MFPMARWLESPPSTRSSIYRRNLFPWCFGKWKECCRRAGCCCSHFTLVMKPFTRMNFGDSPFPWISIYFRWRSSKAIWRPRGLQLSRCLSASLIHQKWNTRAEGHTFLRGNQPFLSGERYPQHDTPIVGNTEVNPEKALWEVGQVG